MNDNEIVSAVIIGVITGSFSAGTIYGIFKIELRNLRRDVGKVLHHLWPEAYPDREAP